MFVRVASGWGGAKLCGRCGASGVLLNSGSAGANLPRAFVGATANAPQTLMNRRFFLAAGCVLILAGCAPKTQTAAPTTVATPPDKVATDAAPADKRVVLYCSVDDVYAKPLIEKLKARTGLEIVALFDTESTKTAGLTTRIRIEKSRPRADVLWTSALLQTLLLEQDGLLDAYDSPAARDLAPRFRGKSWAGVGTRARLIVSVPQLDTMSGKGGFYYGTKRQIVSLNSAPQTGQRSGHSNPQFGTASDEAAALYARDPVQTLKWYRDLKAGKTRILPGNGDVARAVAEGDLNFGWTDTDDYLAQKKRGKPIEVVFTQRNNVLVPGAVAVVKGAPHPENARALFNAIASKQGEADLVAGMPGVFSLRGLDDKTNWKSGGENFDFLNSAPLDDYTQWPQSWAKIREPLAQMFQQ